MDKVVGKENSSKYDELVGLLMVEIYDVDYNYSALVQQSKLDLKGYAAYGVKDEFLSLPNLARLVEQTKNEISSLGYIIPNVEAKILEKVEESIKKEYGEDAKAVSYPGITSERLKEVKASLTKANDFKSYIFQDENPIRVIEKLNGKFII